MWLRNVATRSRPPACREGGEHGKPFGSPLTQLSLAELIPILIARDAEAMTREELIALAETAEERTAGYLRAALEDPEVMAAVHSRYVPAVLDGPTAGSVANDPVRKPNRGRKQG